MTSLIQIQPIKATIKLAGGTTHAVFLTHSDANGENFRAKYIAGQYRGATELVTSSDIIETKE